MNSGELMSGGIRLILLASPVIFAFAAVTYADELIGLLKRTALMFRSRRY